MYFDLNDLEILFHLQINFHYIFIIMLFIKITTNIILSINITISILNTNSKKRYLLKENVLMFFPIFIQEYILTEDHDKLKDLMSFYSHLKNRMNYTIE